MSASSKYAQTNVQLFRQMRSEGYSQDERQLVFESYELGMHLFCGLYLPSGKPFIDHLVGTASILVSLRMSAHIVAAGLLHAAYIHGDFGSARQGITKRKQRMAKECSRQYH
jgi:(p)ppGpp synthase/HD superfamily hydrolase